MQKVATLVFIWASIAFGLIGIVFFVGTFIAEWDTEVEGAVFALWGVSGSVVLASFALSVAGKYLRDQ